MTWRSIYEYAEAVRGRYLAVGKHEKGIILDEFCQATGYHRKSAIRLLNRRPGGARRRRGRERKYGPEVGRVVKVLWEASGCICSKRLAPFIEELLAVLERHGELRLRAEVRGQVLAVSPATIDRLLRPLRPRGLRRPLSQTRSAAALKAQVPIRTFGEWKGAQPGAVQADLVAHCGESTQGFYLTTLVAVDVATGWSEPQAVWGKGQTRVGGAVHQVRGRLPFPLRELHTDNGGEFLNQVLYPYCRRHAINLTRGRPYKKNDQAYAEQKACP